MASQLPSLPLFPTSSTLLIGGTSFPLLSNVMVSVLAWLLTSSFGLFGSIGLLIVPVPSWVGC